MREINRLRAQLASVIGEFQINGAFYDAVAISEGSINSSYLVTMLDKSSTRAYNKYLLQKINISVFHNPRALMSNIYKVCEHIAKNGKAGDVCVSVIKTREGDLLHDENGGCWRCLTYIDNTRTIEPGLKSADLYEAGAAVGRFHKSLLDFPIEELAITIPDFHNTAARMRRFDESIVNGNPRRIAEAVRLLDHIEPEIQRAQTLYHNLSGSGMPVRVVHNDTNLNNILFDKASGRGLCMIDLDTVMPGYIATDFGDLARHCLLLAKEKSRAFDLASFTRLLEGYLSEAEGFITAAETENLYAGLWLITFELGLRFLTDYFSDDKYFKIESEKDNCINAEKQFQLLKDVNANRDALLEAIRGCAAKIA